MSQHQLTDAEIKEVLDKGSVGRIATLNPDGYPYVVPVHYITLGGKIYIHGLIKGQKITNLRANSQVGFEVDDMTRIIPDEVPCDVNTEYKSVIITGDAKMVDDDYLKKNVLNEVVKKYTPQLAGREFPEKFMKATGIIEIGISECTGKYYK